MVYKNVFIIDPNYMQSIKQFRDRLLSMGCMTCLYTCLYNKFETLRDEHLSVGCTCPYVLF